MNKLELESIKRIYSACKEVAGKLEAAGFESVDALINEAKMLRERLKQEEEYSELYREISSDALGTCNQLIDYIKRNNIPQSERVGAIIERMKSSTFQIPIELGIPYIVVCSKGTWYSPEYLKGDRKMQALQPLQAPDEAPAMLKWNRCDLICTRCETEFKDDLLFAQGPETKIRFCPECGAPIAGMLEET